MAGNRPFSMAVFTAMIWYIGQTPLRSGRVGLAIVLRKSDFDAYARIGRSITGATYFAAEIPGQPEVPRGLIAAVREGWRWGAIEHRLLEGRLRFDDAQWIALRWQEGVPT